LAPGAPLHGHTIYIVLDDFGELGRAYRETDETEANERKTIENFLTGQYERPVRVVAFNTGDHMSRDMGCTSEAENFVRQPKRTFSTQSGFSGHGGACCLARPGRE
jgi:hypothetical protein